jgi:RHS repeat-associated protein
MLAHYIYNALNQRVLKQVDDQKTIFIYDQAGKLIEIRGPDSIIDIIYLDDEPIAEVIDGEVYYFVNDRLGTPQYLLGQNGRADWSANILPFRVAAQGSVMQDLRFPGQVEDKESHLVYNNAREYVPHLGRYLQPDPLGLGGGSLNPYTYADNNPVNVTDPTGKNFVIQGLIMGARLAGSAIARVTPASVTNTARAAINTARTAINNYSRKTLPEQVAKITQADKEGQVCSLTKRPSSFRKKLFKTRGKMQVPGANREQRLVQLVAQILKSLQVKAGVIGILIINFLGVRETSQI